MLLAVALFAEAFELCGQGFAVVLLELPVLGEAIAQSGTNIEKGQDEEEKQDQQDHYESNTAN